MTEKVRKHLYQDDMCGNVIHVTNLWLLIVQHDELRTALGAGDDIKTKY